MAGSEDDNNLDNVVRVDFGARRRKEEAPVQASTQLPVAAELAADRPEKLRAFARLIEKGMVMVTLDARNNARVPPHLSGELQLNLNFSHKFGLPDFFYDDYGVRGSLSFQGRPFFCDIAWSTVYGLYSHVDAERILWPDSLPEELKALLPPQARHAAREEPPPPVPPPASPNKPTLRRIK